jgi:hypothetical protein
MNKSNRILTLVFLSIGMLSFAEEEESNEDRWRSQSLEYFSQGAAHLLSDEPIAALEYFDKAHLFSSQIPEAEFCLSFFETIIFDRLGDRERCAHAIASMLRSIEVLKEDDSDEEIDLTDTENSQDVCEMMSVLAHQAPSEDVRAILFSIIEQIKEELLPSFQFADPVYLEEADWGYDYREDFSFQLCKKHKHHHHKHHHHKKHKKSWIEKMYGWIETAYKIVTLGKKVHDTYSEWKEQYLNDDK